MQIDRDKHLSLWNLADFHACDEGMILAQTFLDASGKCVGNQGHSRTSSTRFGLLNAYNAMVKHSDTCEECNEAISKC